MINEHYSILVIDDETVIRRLLQKELTTEDRKVMVAADGTEAQALIRAHWFDVILMDLRLPDINGLDLLIEVKDLLPHTEIVMVTGNGDIDSAVRAMKLGAYDFIPKPFNLEQMDLLIEKAHQRAALARENSLLRHSVQKETLVQFIGKSKAVRDIRFLIDKVAPAKIPVLITGESGAGKDVVARMIHQESKRHNRPIIIKNCASLQKELARSELFGHKKGSFTGANESSEGLLTFAHETTLFLDEVGELSDEVQASLLRVLETQTFRRIGEKDERKVDIRFIFATNRDLDGEVRDGTFNEAFFHRINAFRIKVPSLRERKEDLPLLVDYFLASLDVEKKKFSIAPHAMECIMRYDWPGNIRELRNVIERCLILAEGNLITERCLPAELVPAAEASSSVLTLAAVEKEHILKILEFHGGNRQQTAETLGISRKTLYRKLSSYTSSALAPTSPK